MISIFSSMFISTIVFFLIQGIVVDLIDVYIQGTLYEEKYSILSYIIFIYSLTLYASLFAVSLILSKNANAVKKNILVNSLSLIFTILMMSLISFLFAGYSLKHYFSTMTIIEKISGFYLWNAYFIAYILHDSAAYFFILMIVYFYSYAVFSIISSKSEK